MVTFRVPVPVRLKEPPSPSPDDPAVPVFRDKPDLGQRLLDALGTFALFGSSAPPSSPPISWIDELSFHVYVVIPAAGTVGVGTTAVRPPAPHEGRRSLPVMEEIPRHTYQLLTKRPRRAARMADECLGQAMSGSESALSPRISCGGLMDVVAGAFR
ncbi:hypothetical protein GCM10009743_24860 [Kribbella swartbergensis]